MKHEKYGNEYGNPNLTIVREWADDRDDPPADEWPYPNEWVEHEVTGILAEDVRAKLGVSADAPVIITECIESGGYSEYTQENWHSFTLDCAGESIEFSQTDYSSAFRELCKWLEKP